MFSAKMSFKRIVSALILVSFVGAGTLACDEDPLRKGQAALFSENPDVAETSLKKVLAKEPDNVEAKRLMAEVHRLRKDFAQSEKTLMELWKSQGLDDATKELTPEKKTLKKNMAQQFEDVYREWAASIDTKESPEKFLEVVTKGLERDPKDTKLNPLVVDYWLASAETLLEEGKKLEASEAFEKVLAYRAMPKQRADAESRAKNLRLEVFTESAQNALAAVKEKLKTEERWDEERKALKVIVEREVDNALKATNPEDLQAARKSALGVVTQSLVDGVAEITGHRAKPAVATKLGLPKHAMESEDVSRGKYTMTAYLAADDAIAWAFKSAESDRKASNDEPAEAPSEKTEDGDSDEGTEGEAKSDAGAAE